MEQYLDTEVKIKCPDCGSVDEYTINVGIDLPSGRIHPQTTNKCTNCEEVITVNAALDLDVWTKDPCYG